MYSRITVSSLPTVDTKYPRAQKCCPTKFRFFSPYTRAKWIALLPLINPITCDNAYLGGIAIIMCTWSGIRCPSSIRLSFCSASLRNTSPKCRRSSPYRIFLRHLGINTTWYLHSHLVWLRLSTSSIANSFSCALAAHVWESLRWTAVSVKLLLPPRQSRGVSQRTSSPPTFCVGNHQRSGCPWLDRWRAPWLWAGTTQRSKHGISRRPRYPRNRSHRA